MLQNEQKNAPHSDTLGDVIVVKKGEGWSLCTTDGNGNFVRAPDETLEAYARERARCYKDKSPENYTGLQSFEENLRWFRKKENRRDAARTLRRAERYLRRIAFLLRDHPQVPTIYVKEFRDPPSEGESKATDYISLGQLGWIANWLDANPSPKGAASKITVRAVAIELEEFFRQNYGRPRWDLIGKIITEEFPGAQNARRPKKKNGSTGDYADWARQLAKRRQGKAVKSAAVRQKKEL
jgi:hypothetical protein